MATIICDQCGAQRKGAPANTKLCTDCILLRDLTYWSNRAALCAGSSHPAGVDKAFLPTRRGDRLCGHCDLSPYRGPCRWCKTDPAELIRADIPVCLRCTKEPAKRNALVRTLRTKQDERRDRNTVTP